MPSHRIVPPRSFPHPYEAPAHALALVCPFCQRPVILVWDRRDPRHKWNYMPIEIDSWELVPSNVYMRGYHKTHKVDCGCPFGDMRRYTYAKEFDISTEDSTLVSGGVDDKDRPQQGDANHS